MIMDQLCATVLPVVIAYAGCNIHLTRVCCPRGSPSLYTLGLLSTLSPQTTTLTATSAALTMCICARLALSDYRSRPWTGPWESVHVIPTIDRVMYFQTVRLRRRRRIADSGRCDCLQSVGFSNTRQVRFQSSAEFLDITQGAQVHGIP